MAYHLTPDLHSCVWRFCKWKINPRVLKIKAIGKNNGELIAGEISEEENLIFLLMEEHLLFINLSPNRYATLQLNQRTQSLLFILAMNIPLPWQRRHRTCWDTTRQGRPVAKQALLYQALELGSMDRSVQPELLCSMGPCVMLDDLAAPTLLKHCWVTGWWEQSHTAVFSPPVPLWHRSITAKAQAACFLPLDQS